MYDANITLDELLVSREERAANQRKLIKKYSCPLICFTVIMPGSEKLNRLSRRIFEGGVSAIENQLTELGIKHISEIIKKTGPEGYFAVNADDMKIKGKMISIEDSHPWGRLFDIDVIGMDFAPLSRRDLGYGERKCLLCCERAAVCVKSRRHTTSEILTRIGQICGV